MKTKEDSGKWKWRKSEERCLPSFLLFSELVTARSWNNIQQRQQKQVLAKSKSTGQKFSLSLTLNRYRFKVAPNWKDGRHSSNSSRTSGTLSRNRKSEKGKKLAKVLGCNGSSALTHICTLNRKLNYSFGGSHFLLFFLSQIAASLFLFLSPLELQMLFTSKQRAHSVQGLWSAMKLCVCVCVLCSGTTVFAGVWMKEKSINKRETKWNGITTTVKAVVAAAEVPVLGGISSTTI